jgi:hypothetical protein
VFFALHCLAWWKTGMHLRSKGKSMLENLDWLQDKGKPIPDKAHRLLENSELKSGNTGESQDKAKLTLGKEANEE